MSSPVGRRGLAHDAVWEMFLISQKYLIFKFMVCLYSIIDTQHPLFAVILPIRDSSGWRGWPSDLRRGHHTSALWWAIPSQVVCDWVLQFWVTIELKVFHGSLDAREYLKGLCDQWSSEEYSNRRQRFRQNRAAQQNPIKYTNGYIGTHVITDRLVKIFNLY